VVKFLGSWI